MQALFTSFTNQDSSFRPRARGSSHAAFVGAELHVAAFSDFRGYSAGTGDVTKNGVHFLGRGAGRSYPASNWKRLGSVRVEPDCTLCWRRVGGVVFLAVVDYGSLVAT